MTKKAQDYSNAKVESGIPVPPKSGSSDLTPLITQMRPGDSVELSASAARSLASALRNQGFKPVLRTTTTGKARVWKMSS